MPELCVLNGRLVPTKAASISVDDWAFRYGWGLFETIRIRSGCPLFFERHIDRLCTAAQILELGEEQSIERKRWESDVRNAVRRARMQKGIVNCYWTKGSSLPRARPSRIVRIRPLPRYSHGPLSLWVAPWRLEPTYPGSGVKTLAYFPYMFAGLSARREGCDEALVLNTRGRIADGAASSIFVIHRDEVLTSRLHDGALAGVTRGITIELLKSLGVTTREMSIPWSRFIEADRIFITSALRGIVEVISVKGHWQPKDRAQNDLLDKIKRLYNNHASKYVTDYQSLY